MRDLVDFINQVDPKFNATVVIVSLTELTNVGGKLISVNMAREKASRSDLATVLITDHKGLGNVYKVGERYTFPMHRLLVVAAN